MGAALNNAMTTMSPRTNSFIAFVLKLLSCASAKFAQVPVEQLVEKMYAGFAAHREPSGGIGRRAEPALDRAADCRVFDLDFVAHRDALFVAAASLRRQIREVKIEDHLGPVDCAWQDQIGIHDPFVAVDHEVRIDPVVQRLRALANRTGSFDDRTRLYAESVAI